MNKPSIPMTTPFPYCVICDGWGGNGAPCGKCKNDAGSPLWLNPTEIPTKNVANLHRIEKAETAIIERCDPEIADYNRFSDGSYEEIEAWAFPCQSCGDIVSISDRCDIEDATADMWYCGKNQYCVP